MLRGSVFVTVSRAGHRPNAAPRRPDLAPSTLFCGHQPSITVQGRVFYIDHVNQNTSWIHPSECVRGDCATPAPRRAAPRRAAPPKMRAIRPRMPPPARHSPPCGSVPRAPAWTRRIVDDDATADVAATNGSQAKASLQTADHMGAGTGVNGAQDLGANGAKVGSGDNGFAATDSLRDQDGSERDSWSPGELLKLKLTLFTWKRAVVLGFDQASAKYLVLVDDGRRREIAISTTLHKDIIAESEQVQAGRRVPPRLSPPPPPPLSIPSTLHALRPAPPRQAYAELLETCLGSDMMNEQDRAGAMHTLLTGLGAAIDKLTARSADDQRGGGRWTNERAQHLGAVLALLGQLKAPLLLKRALGRALQHRQDGVAAAAVEALRAITQLHRLDLRSTGASLEGWAKALREAGAVEGLAQCLRAKGRPELQTPACRAAPPHRVAPRRAAALPRTRDRSQQRSPRTAPTPPNAAMRRHRSWSSARPLRAAPRSPRPARSATAAAAATAAR